MKFLNRHFRRPISNGNRFRAMSRTMVSIGHTRIYFSLISRSNQYPFFFFHSFETDSKLHLNRNLFFFFDIGEYIVMIIEKCGICDTCNFNQFNDSMFRHRNYHEIYSPILCTYLFSLYFSLRNVASDVLGECSWILFSTMDSEDSDH